MKQLHIYLVLYGHVGSSLLCKAYRVRLGVEFEMYGAMRQVKSPKPKSKKSKLFGKAKEKEKGLSSLDIHTNLYSLRSARLNYGRKFVPVKIIGKRLILLVNFFCEIQNSKFSGQQI